MKKIIMLCFTGLLFAGVKAQIKTAYISITDMVSIMPETLQIEQLIESYKTDSIRPQYDRLLASYQTDLAKYNDSLNTTPAVHKQLEETLTYVFYQLQNWQQVETQAVEARQNALLDPIYRKVYDAIKLVAKEKGYTHVSNKESFLIAPVGDDLITAVAAKLKVTLPKTITVGAGR